jgi:hypothetical protein
MSTTASPLRPTAVALMLLVLTAACGREPAMSEGMLIERDAVRSDAADMAVGAPGYAAAPEEAGAPPTAQTQATDPMLIRTGSARIQVDSLEPAVVQVRALAQRLGGMISNSVMQSGAHQLREASLTIKIPATRFDEAIGGLGPIGRTEAVQVNTEDVGEEFVDISARLASARQLEQRLLEILRTRTGKLEDVLAVERELARVRTEIERYEGRLRYLRSRVDMSLLTVSLHEPTPLIAGTPGENVIARALRQAWRNFVGLLATSIAALGFLLPLGIIAGALIWAFRRVRRSRTPAAQGA